MARSFALVLLIALTAPAAHAATVQDCTTAACSQDRSKDGFGAGYTVLSRTTDTGGVLGIDDRLTVRGELFGITSSLAQVRAVGSSSPKHFEVDTYVWLPVFGKTQIASDEPANLGLIVMSNEISRRFVNVEQRFYGVLKVTASASGAAGYEAIGLVDSSHVQTWFKPYINATVRVTAGVDIYVGGFGAYGLLYLVDAGLPMTTNIAATSTPGCAASYVRVDAEVTVLSGELGWYVTLLTLEHHDDLYDWPGYTLSTPVMPATRKTVCL